MERRWSNEFIDGSTNCSYFKQQRKQPKLVLPLTDVAPQYSLRSLISTEIATVDAYL